MAIGDIINGIGANTTSLTFTPAAGVEIIIFQASAGDTPYIHLSNGVTRSQIYASYSGTTGLGRLVKIGITNTNYLQIDAGTAEAGSYSGIQIK